jgi:hypothetical protein
MRESSALR